VAAQNRSAALSQPMPAVAPGSAQPVLDRKILLSTVEQDLGLLRELAELFFAESPALLSQIRNGIQAGEAESVERAAHTLKGALSNFGAVSACDAARDLEVLARQARFDGAPQLFSILEREVGRACNALSSFLQEASREGSPR